MSNITVDTHTHNKTRNHKEKRKELEHKLEDIGSVAKAIYIARSIYRNTLSASHAQIDAAEDWINSSVKVSKRDIEYYLAVGDLKRSCSSQRLFIQLNKG